MGSTQIRVCRHGYIRMMIIYLLLLFASTYEGFIAEGRVTSMLMETAQRNMELEEGLVMVRKGHIGSRPPKCEGRCTSCGRCEAVQVPVVPQAQSHGRTTHSVSATRSIPHSRGDDLSNYKPMSWKCKCGDYFFNP